MRDDDLSRRLFLGAGAVAAAQLLLGACDSKGPRSAQRFLRYMERKNEGIERALFRHTAMDAGSPGHRLAGSALPSYYISRTVPAWDESLRGVWRLEIAGLVARPLALSLPELMRVPRITHRVNHYCVEGWTAIEEWTGCRLRELAKIAGASREARFVDFQSFDSGYHESWDIESALHPQTVIAYGLDGSMLGAAHGAPARLFSPIKLGYKNVKYLTRIVFLPAANGGYWSDRGYEWYAGV
jgi:DMSO/TMAO reductase YedYZ molybdopterin-dependent catalytic subunit